VDTHLFHSLSWAKLVGRALLQKSSKRREYQFRRGLFTVQSGVLPVCSVVYSSCFQAFSFFNSECCFDVSFQFDMLYWYHLLCIAKPLHNCRNCDDDGVWIGVALRGLPRLCNGSCRLRSVVCFLAAATVTSTTSAGAIVLLPLTILVLLLLLLPLPFLSLLLLLFLSLPLLSLLLSLFLSLFLFTCSSVFRSIRSH
jgi:hypothetical protein